LRETSSSVIALDNADLKVSRAERTVAGAGTSAQHRFGSRAQHTFTLDKTARELFIQYQSALIFVERLPGMLRDEWD